ncbi:LexA family transcriptional regulator [Desulfovibrio inopinatus]|uniref:LexA family transcriptional regulator n=1 Tax=Desulfovibrio inopinatus TaxID=102109 RepID=UPI00041C9AFD|nr:S24 family peptidase [Desulfovibrio inopinatus]
MFSDFDEAIERIKKATGTRTQVELAKILDIRQSSISDAKRRKSIPSDWLIKLFRSHGLNPDWITSGQEPQCLKDGLVTPIAVSESGAIFGADRPKFKNVDVSAMSGLSEDGQWCEQHIESIAIPTHFTRKSLLVVKMDGTSMEPLIRHGAYVGIDRENTWLRSGEIYALYIPVEGLVIKRVTVDYESKRIILHSQNPDLQDQFLPLEGSPERVIGRVIWVFQEI